MVQDFDGASVVDPNGNSIGTVERTFDDAGGIARFIEVKIGALFAKHRLVPIDGERVTDNSITVPYTREIIEDSPDASAIDTTLAGDLLQRAGQYYSDLGDAAIPASMVATRSDETNS